MDILKKNWLWITKFGLSAATLVKLGIMLSENDYSRLVPGFLGIFLIFAVDFIRRFTNFKVNRATEIVYLMFLVISLFLGFTWKWYEYIDWFDKFAHTFSGVFSGLAGLVILRHYKMAGKTTKDSFQILFINSFSVMIAFVWEVFEFVATIMTGTDFQHVGSTGATDTMWDMIVATCGSLIFTFAYLAMRERQEKS